MVVKSLSYIQDPYELELLDGCMQHDRNAQRALYNKYKDAMYTLLVRMFNDEEDAADALQEAFIEVFRSLKNYRGASSLGAWIKTIVIRSALCKQKTIRPFEPMSEFIQDHQPIVWDVNLTGEYLEKAIQKLPAGYRNVFLLVEVEGYTHREVAKILGIAEGTAKSQLFQAKKMLQRLLKDLME
jgi:RNA polymerase sigma-70 factor (ECF subfamily)